MPSFAGLETSPASEVLSWALTTYGSDFGIATSFQREGMVIIDLAGRAAAGMFRVFTLDTGRLPDETYLMMEKLRERYGVAVEVVTPSPEDVEPMVSLHGPNLFYQSPELRARCCEVRKVRPMQRKLREFRAWATGLRREQAGTRAGIPKAEEVDGRLKLCPLADWTAQQVEEYTREQDLPVHPLYSRGYSSIGCAPCTRAIEPGEDERAGRWWWEQGARKECGIHFTSNGTVERNA